METETTTQKCAACDGGVEKLSHEQVRQRIDTLGGWRLTDDGQRIRKNWKMRNFRAAMALLNQVAELAEAQGHHPDLHLEQYRHVSIAIWTHAIGGLSELDFVLAAEIDQLPAAQAG